MKQSQFRQGPIFYSVYQQMTQANKEKRSTKLLYIRQFFGGFYHRETSHLRSFVKIKPSRNSKNTLSFTNIGKSRLSREIRMCFNANCENFRICSNYAKCVLNLYITLYAKTKPICTCSVVVGSATYQPQNT